MELLYAADPTVWEPDDDPHGWMQVVPDGHPDEPCPGNHHCPLRLVVSS